MTTIATDGITIAADGLRIWGTEVRGIDHPKIVVKGGAIFAFSGLAPMFAPIMEWRLAGAKVEDLPKCGTDADWGTLIVIGEPGFVHKYSHSCPYVETFDVREDPIAFGVGADYAMGAMWMGASPREAVELVAKHTNATGGIITEVNIAEALGLARQAAE